MSWTLLVGLALGIGLALFAAIHRRAEIAGMERRVLRRERAVRSGSARAQLRYPNVDLSRCVGCGTCVAACPEEGVLELVHGQATVVNGARCVGHALCERECPVGAITVTLDNLEERRDIPVLTDRLEAVGTPGLFLAGEVTAHALVKTAVDQGTAVAAEVARRVESAPEGEPGALDLCVVGAGPAGLACSLEAKRRGLRFVTLEQEEEIGGTVAKYPRRKLVLSQPIDLPRFGRLRANAYTKEALVGLWRRIVEEQALPIRCGEILQAVERDPAGRFVVRTAAGAFAARHVCLAVGRRGTPRRLDVPGEDLPNVAYSLIDAHSYRGRRILVVGGGDSAVEAAMGLSEQPGNEVTLSYRQEAFFRVRARNERRLAESLARRKLRVLLRSRVLTVRPGAVDLSVSNGAGTKVVTLENDDVFVMAGGVPPIEVLERSGISFDPALRESAPRVGEQGTGIVRALGAAFAFTLVALAWALVHSDYYLLAGPERAAHGKHEFLRPGRGAGLALGFAATALIGLNLLYLVRRAPRLRLRLGSLRTWMTSHVATGVLALLCAILHAAMAPRDTAGGHAIGVLVVLVCTGAVGRYFYAAVPRAANGRELALEEVKARLLRLSEEWDRGPRKFGDRVRHDVLALVHRRQWKSSFPGRVVALLGGARDLRRLLGRLAADARREGLAEDQIEETLRLARKAHRIALTAAHYEDLRALLNGWRWVHRWGAALLVALVLLHVVYALSYGGAFADAGMP